MHGMKTRACVNKGVDNGACEDWWGRKEEGQGYTDAGKVAAESAKGGKQKRAKRMVGGMKRIMLTMKFAKEHTETMRAERETRRWVPRRDATAHAIVFHLHVREKHVVGVQVGANGVGLGVLNKAGA